MVIDHEVMRRHVKQLDDVLDNGMPANEADKEVQHCIMLFTYSYAMSVLESEDPKETFKIIPKKWQDDVRHVCKLIRSHSKTAKS